MRPVADLAANFVPDQQPNYTVKVWDTPFAFVRGDRAGQGMQLRVREPASVGAWASYVEAWQSATASAIEAAFTGTSVATVSDGRCPLIQSYWGSGAPNWWGSTKAGQVSVCFSGEFLPTAQRDWLTTGTTLTFAAAGNGLIKIVKVPAAGVPTVLLSTELTEVGFLQDGPTLSTTATFAAGDTLRVYYLQRGTEDWGGLVVKALAGTLPSDSQDLSAAIAAAPVLGMDLFNHGALLEPVTLDFITQVEVVHEKGSASRASLELPLINPSEDRNDGHGWLFIRSSPDDPGALQLMDEGVEKLILRRKRLIQISTRTLDSTGTPAYEVPVFTGFVDDFADVQQDSVQVSCVGFEGRLVEQYEQVPDRISYMARDFRLVDPMRAEAYQRGQPVYNVPAFDAWPLEYAVQEFAHRAGICSSKFFALNTVLANDKSVVVPDEPWLSYTTRAYTSNGTPIRLPRPVHYGNTGLAFTETRPFDDEYLFKVEPTKDMWARVRELTDRMGYRVWFNEAGDLSLYPENIPSRIVDLLTTDVTTGSGTYEVNPAAYAARYVKTTGTAAFAKTVSAARIDISFPRAPGLGQWTVTVKEGSTVRNTFVVDPSASSEQFLFDASLSKPTSNSTIVTAWPPQTANLSEGYGTYTVELTSTGGSGSTERRVDCLLCYAVDPDRSLLPGPIDTGDLGLTVRATQSADEMRNKVTIVGRRKAQVTDSEKFAEIKQPTEQEFVVQNAVDHNSITDPTSLNYVGYPKQSMIYDSSIGDDGFARYLAQVFIYRQRVPRPGAGVETTFLPFVQPGDPVLVNDSKYNVLADSTVYVTSVTHRFAGSRATTSLVGSPWPDYPAYEPRYDIDLADFDNQPVIDVGIRYTTLSGHTVENLTGNYAKPVLDTTAPGNIVQYTGLSVSGGSLNLPGGAPWPPIPGTMQVRLTPSAASGPISESIKTRDMFRWLKGQQLIEYTIPPNWVIVEVIADVRNTTFGSTKMGPYLVTQEPRDDTPFYYKLIGSTVVLYGNRTNILPPGDNDDLRLRVFYRTTDTEQSYGWVSNNPYHTYTSFSYANGSTTISLPWAQGDGTTRFGLPTGTWDVRYKSLFPPSSGVDPNVLPVGVDDNGEPFSPFYDPYTSELGHLVEVSFASLVEGLFRVSLRSAFDGTVVAWLTGAEGDPQEPEKHWEYLSVGVNRFYWDGVDQLGAWNTDQSELYASLVDGAFGASDTRERVGSGFYVWNQEIRGGKYSQLAYIWTKRDANGKPIIGHGTYGQWYVVIESISDRLPGTVAVDTLDDQNLESGVYCYTHLPEPTKVRLKVSDWVSSSPFSPTATSGASAGSVEENWGTLSTSTPAVNEVAATLNNAKPVRLRFYVEQRPGKLWENKREEASVKLARHVHLRAYIADQTIIDKGIAYPGTITRQRTLANRRLVNDEHTNVYEDTGYRKAKQFRWVGDAGDAGTTEWIFRPEDFKREFLYSGVEQPIQFGNYLQLEEVPGWSTTRDLASERSRLQFALMSYLFYLSSMVTDRSGRTTWALNTSFVDKSKLVNNTTPVTWGDDPAYQLRRTIVCRQWTQEPTWKDSQLARYGASAGSLLDKLLEHWWWQHEPTATTIGTAEAAWSSFSPVSDDYSAFHVSNSAFQPKLPSAYNAARQLGTASTSLISGWSWSTSPAWAPSITRDLHPFFLLPPMCLPPLDVDSIKDRINDPLGRFVLEYDLRRWNCYLTTAGPNVTVEIAEAGERALSMGNWGDNAHAETFSSAIWDMTESTSARKRFFLGTKVDKEQEPCKSSGVSTNSLDYLRQDEATHWEDLRGVYSRSQLPASGVVKASPVAPYYLNSMTYYGIGSRTAFRNPGYPAFFVTPNYSAVTGLGIPAFRIAFRHEYVWESGSYFPANDRGAERTDAVNWWNTRYLSLAEVGSVYYDHGGWVGWKDDVPLSHTGGSPRVLGGLMKSFSNTEITDYFTPFAAPWMPVASSTVLPTTVELIAHLVLVPERRGA